MRVIRSRIFAYGWSLLARAAPNPCAANDRSGNPRFLLREGSGMSLAEHSLMLGFALGPTNGVLLRMFGKAIREKLQVLPHPRASFR